MARTKTINSQLGNFQTYLMYNRQCKTLAENVFRIKYLPDFIDISYLNKTLLKNGAVVFFYDEILKKLLALPFIPIGVLDVYGRPTKLEAIGENGYRKILKNSDEFVIMYDNNGRYSLYIDICQYAERLALATRVIDINLAQQKTPRFWKTSSGNERTIKDLVNNVDSFENVIITYDNMQVDDTTMVMAPAPYVADKVHQDKEKIWNEFLRLIGISNMNFQKKERNIKDEVIASQGGTIASRYSRFEPRKKAIDEINKKFKQYLERDIEIEYYDGIPTTEENLDSKEDDENVLEN